jgi:hypothetical protein
MAQVPVVGASAGVAVDDAGDRLADSDESESEAVDELPQHGRAKKMKTSDSEERFNETLLVIKSQQELVMHLVEQNAKLAQESITREHELFAAQHETMMCSIQKTVEIVGKGFESMEGVFRLIPQMATSAATRPL